MTAKAIGIDLGTTFSCVGVVDDSGAVKIIHNEQGNRITPSCVHLADENVMHVGENAVPGRGTDPKNTFYQIKRFMGRRADDKFIKERTWPFEVLAGSNGRAQLRVHPSGKTEVLYPEQISAFILTHMKAVAEKYLQIGVKDAVITVPANFNDAQRQATKDAGTIAGLNVLRVVNEPTAAAIAYGHGKKDGKTRNILVYDLGGGTFDVSIVKMTGLDATVMATSGLMDLGGEDFDRRIYEEATARFVDQDVTFEGKEWELLRACELAKRQLSSQESAQIEIIGDNGKKIGFPLVRDTLNELCEDLFQRTLTCVIKAMKDAKVTTSDLDDIVMVGGSSRIPRVQYMLQNHFGGRHIRYDIHPDEAVAYGAAIIARSLSNPNAADSVRLSDVTPLSLGIQIVNDVMVTVIPANTPYPTGEFAHGFNNAAPFIRSLTFAVYEGERPTASDNCLLGQFDVEVPPREYGENKIDAKFSIDANGILTVRAIVTETGVSASITVQRGRLSADKVEQMILNAQRRAHTDKMEKERRLALTQYESAVYGLRRDARNATTQADKDKLNRDIEIEQSWLLNNKDTANTEVFRARTESINEGRPLRQMSLLTVDE